MTAFLSCHSVPPLVILSAAKNLFSCLKGMVRKILRSEAPQNDREGGEAHLRMTERGEKPRRGMTAFLPCHSERSEESSLPSLSFFTPPPVILSAAKNLYSRPKDMVRRILRSEAPQNDRRGSSPPNDREGGEPRRGMTAFLSCHSVPPLVILSAAKNLFSRPCHSLPHPLSF